MSARCDHARETVVKTVVFVEDCRKAPASIAEKAHACRQNSGKPGAFLALAASESSTGQLVARVVGSTEATLRDRPKVSFRRHFGDLKIQSLVLWFCEFAIANNRCVSPSARGDRVAISMKIGYPRPMGNREFLQG
jgi:hypothetical protein